MHFSDVNGTEDDTFVEINNGNADEDEGKDNSDQPDVLPLSRVLFIVCVVYHFFFNNTITDGGVAPQCSFARPTRNT